MAYIKYTGTEKKYKGESFKKTLEKRDGIWTDRDIATYELYDEKGGSVSKGTLERSSDDKELSFVIPSADTENLVGKFKLLVTLNDRDDDRYSSVIAEYDLIFEERKA